MSKTIPLVFLFLLAGCGTIEEILNVEEERSDIGEERPDIEIWYCMGQLAYSLYMASGDFPEDEVAARLIPDSEEAGVSAKVLVAGVDYPAIYYVKGIDRRWDFGDGYRYSFVVRPDGSAAYYDFSRAEQGEEVSPKQIYFCVK